MKKFIRCLAVICCVVALAATVLGICAAMINRDSIPVLLKASQKAQQAADDMLQAVADGEYEKAASMMLGLPDLGVDREAETQVGKFLWKAYQDSLEFTPRSELYAMEEGAALDYTVRYLEVDSVSANIRACAELLLQKRVEEAVELSEVYNEKHEYREDVVMDVLYDAAEMALKENGAYVEKDFTVKLTCRNGEWWVLPDQQLLAAISGGLAG